MNQRDAEFSDFVRAHRPELLTTARLLMSGDAHRGEDLVQTSLARLYLAWPRLRSPNAALTYTRQIMLRAAIDEKRRPWWRREQSMADPADLAEPAALEVDGFDIADGARIRAALAALGPRMRAVVVLRHWLDLSTEETATLLGCTTGTVKSQNSKALAQLRLALTADTAITRRSS